MVLAEVSGGLGNQMFQYALVIGLQETFKEEIYADISSYKNYNLHNGLELERVFPVSLKKTKRNPLLTRKLTFSRTLNHYLPFICGGHSHHVSRRYQELWFVYGIIFGVKK